MRCRTRVSDLRASPTRGLHLLVGAVLGVAACQANEHAPFYDPSVTRGDGGQYLPGNSSDVTDGSVGGADGGGPKPPAKPIFMQSGDPMGFDPTQVYVHGRFLGGESVVTAYAEPCIDGGASGLADWSSPKNNWMNPNGNGITVTLPCEADDPRVRIDGTILYETAQRGVRAFSQELVEPDGRHIALSSKFGDSAESADPEVAVCGSPKNFRHWLSPSGMIVASCHTDDGTMLPYVLEDTPLTEVKIPDGYVPAHLGFDNHILLHQIGMPKRAGVWSPDGGLKKLADLLPFAFEQVGAIRADTDGFVLLVVKRDDDPPDLSQWHISNSGTLGKESKYPTLEGVTLDPSNCDEYFPGGAPLSGTLDPGLSVDHFRSAGCACALDADGAALCIARDTKMSQLIVRFEIGAQAGEIVYRVEKDPFLIDFKGLVTGP